MSKPGADVAAIDQRKVDKLGDCPEPPSDHQNDSTQGLMGGVYKTEFSEFKRNKVKNIDEE